MSGTSVIVSGLFVFALAVLPQATPPPQTQPPPKPQTPPAQTTPPPKPQTPPAQTTPAPKPQTPPGGQTGTGAPKPPPRPATASKPAVLELSVTTMVGATIPGATVRAEGPTSRMGTTGPDGRLVFENLTAGTYRIRAERESFVTLEKEIVVFAGGRTPAQAVLSAAPAAAAPPPPAAPPPAPTPATPVLKPGDPKIVSLPDLAEQLLRETDPVAERALGCSGATNSRLIRVRDAIAAHSHADADELVYIVAGDATIKLGEKEQNISPGWFSIIPRGTSHTITRRNRNPILILSSISGPPCQ